MNGWRWWLGWWCDDDVVDVDNDHVDDDDGDVGDN
jgi:hypothetical protein